MTRRYNKARTHRLGERCEVSAYTPTARLQAIAEERTDGMVSYYLMASRPPSLHAGIEDLGTLARSCYMQGVNDILDVIAKGVPVDQE